MTEGKMGHSLSMSETNGEMNLTVKNPLYDVTEEVKETEMKDVVEDNIAASSKASSSGNYVKYLCWGLLTISNNKV